MNLKFRPRNVDNLYFIINFAVEFVLNRKVYAELSD